jgi:hypothetical protein
VRVTPTFRSIRTLLVAGLVAGSLAACSESTDPTPAPVGTVTVVPEPNMRAEDIASNGSTVLLTDVASPTSDFYFYNVGTGTLALKGSAETHCSISALASRTTSESAPFTQSRNRPASGSRRPAGSTWGTSTRPVASMPT